MYVNECMICYYWYTFIFFRWE